jgi:hypothetical protein
VRDTETFIYLDIVKEIYAWDSPAPAAADEGRLADSATPPRRQAEEVSSE